MQKFIVVIPARLASTRLPRKPLVDILGKSLIQRTYEQCILAADPTLVYVATDSQEIADHCRARNMQVVMTSSQCLTGTDRVAEVANQIEAEYYINVQGDEPLINPADIRAVVDSLNHFPGEIINGFAPIYQEEQYRSLTVPKVVFRPDGRLLYMSRSPIPGSKNTSFIEAWRQVCIYAFPKKSLLKFSEQRSKTRLEASEDIEILRFLELGYEVRMIQLSEDSIAVDTQEDVVRVINVLKLKEI